MTAKLNKTAAVASILRKAKVTVDTDETKRARLITVICKTARVKVGRANAYYTHFLRTAAPKKSAKKSKKAA